MPLSLFLPALVFGLVTIALLVRGLGFRVLGPAVGRGSRTPNPVLLGYAVVAAIVCAIFLLMGIGASQVDLSGFDPD